MNKQIKTNLQFILAAILLVTVAVVGCDNGKTDKTTTKTTVVDTMEHVTGDSAPIIPPK